MRGVFCFCRLQPAFALLNKFGGLPIGIHIVAYFDLCTLRVILKGSRSFAREGA